MSGKAAESFMMMMMWISFPVPSPVKEIQVIGEHWDKTEHLGEIAFV